MTEPVAVRVKAGTQRPGQNRSLRATMQMRSGEGPVLFASVCNISMHNGLYMFLESASLAHRYGKGEWGGLIKPLSSIVFLILSCNLEGDVLQSPGGELS